MNETQRTSDAERPAPRIPRLLFHALIATVTVVVTSGIMYSMRPKRASAPSNMNSVVPASPLEADEGLEGLVIPDFRLVDQFGKPVNQTIFDGRITILDFSFTNCPFVCPGMNAAMLMLQSQLVGTSVRFASISVDPRNDVPEVLKSHADKIGVDHARWTWLTGEEAEIKRIVSESLKFELQDDPSRPITLADGSVMNNIIHPSRLFLIGPERQLLALYPFSDMSALDALKRRAESGARMLQKR